jgi:hypothetical protein
MDTFRDVEGRALAKLRDALAEWTPELPPEPEPLDLSPEEARLIVEALAGSGKLADAGSLGKGLDALLGALELMDTARRLLPPVVRLEALRLALLDALVDVDRILEETMDLGDRLAPQQRATRRGVVVKVGGAGAPPSLYALEVEAALREVAPRRRLGRGNTKGTRRRIRERLAGRWPEERLSEEALSEELRKILASERKAGKTPQ